VAFRKCGKPKAPVKTARQPRFDYSQLQGDSSAI
jgi:hypothetical protein